jgi:hypothetical protein
VTETGVGRVALAGGESSGNVGGTPAWLWEVKAAETTGAAERTGDAAADAFQREAPARGPEEAGSDAVCAPIAV